MTNAQAGCFSAYAIGCLILYIPGRYTKGQVLLLKGCWSCRCLEPGFSGLIIAFSMNYTTALVVFFLQLPPALCSRQLLNKGLENTGRKKRIQVRPAVGIMLWGSVISLICDWLLGSLRLDGESHDMFRTILAMSLAVMVAGALVQLTFATKVRLLQQASEDSKFKLSDVGKAIKNPYLWWASCHNVLIYTIYSNISYFTLYLSSQVGMDVSDSAFVGIIRGYVFYFSVSAGRL